MTEIKENYDTPSDLKFVSRPMWGLSLREDAIILSAIIVGVVWWNVAGILYLPSIIMKAGLVVIGLFALGFGVLRLDVWIYHAIKWLMEPYYVTKFDTVAKQVSGIAATDGAYYRNVDGDLCAMFRLSAINSDRVDSAHVERVEDADETFLNSLPCPVQIVGYTYNYDITHYIDEMLSCAKGLPDSVIRYRVAHLNFYRNYVQDQNIRERVLYLIIRVDALTADPKDTLDMNAAIIQKNLVSCGNRVDRMNESEIRTAMLMIATGIGETGADYISSYTEVMENDK